MSVKGVSFLIEVSERQLGGQLKGYIFKGLARTLFHSVYTESPPPGGPVGHVHEA